MIRMRQEWGRLNFWGYTAGYYFAPKSSYASSANPILEFQRLVRSLHDTGIELIMEFFFPKEVNPVAVLEVLRLEVELPCGWLSSVGEGVWPDMILEILC